MPLQIKRKLREKLQKEQSKNVNSVYNINMKTGMLKLTQEDGTDVWIQCSKILYLDGDNSASQTATVVYLEGNREVRVQESLNWVRRAVCPH